MDQGFLSFFFPKPTVQWKGSLIYMFLQFNHQHDLVFNPNSIGESGYYAVKGHSTDVVLEALSQRTGKATKLGLVGTMAQSATRSRNTPH